MAEPPSFTPTSDAEAKSLVRALTDYSDNADELPEGRLQSHLDIVKMELHNHADVDEADIYADAGLAQALVAGTAIKSKIAVENYSVVRWRIGDQEIDTAAFNNPENAQLETWHQMHSDGLRASDQTSAYAPSNSVGYIG